jgi:hypothetical protein
MAFTTLADRFEQKSKEIYSRFSPSTGQFVTVKPDTEGVFGSRSRIKNDNRSIPTVSVLRDTQRVSRFLTSPEGVLFTTKQALLQTGNTFLNTKLYNPLSPALNVIPFLHIRRNVPTNTLVPSPSGLLQSTTVNTVASRFETIGKLQAFSSGQQRGLPTIGSLAKNYLVTQLKNAANAIVPLPQFYTSSRPEYKAFQNGGVRIFPAQPLSQRGIVRTNVVATITNVITSKVTSRLVQSSTSALNRLIPKSLRNIVPPIPSVPIPAEAFTFEQEAARFKNNFYKKAQDRFIRTGNNSFVLQEESRFKSKYFSEAQNPVENAYDSGIVQVIKDPEVGRTALKDLYNIAPFESNVDNFDAEGNLIDNRLNYANITKAQPDKSDIIKFIFRDASDVNNTQPVHFRALISSIKESVKPEFNEQRYVGRTERFVTYGGVKRGLSLSFNIVAFSQQELDGMWTKVNYLTGMAFPKGIKNGFMVPPLFKFTIGGLYDNQPCYIESLDYDFLDETITFDIDKEVPFAINVTMQLSILEKRSKFHNSPFYQITENAEQVVRDRRNATNQASAINLFNSQA